MKRDTNNGALHGGDYDIYHAIWLSPTASADLRATYSSPLSPLKAFNLAYGLMTLDHESQHQRLESGDEGYVNACALKDMPRLLQVDLKIKPTTSASVRVPVTVRVKQRYRGHYRYVKRTHYVTRTKTVANPDYAAILKGAHDFYNEQPPPYTGDLLERSVTHHHHVEKAYSPTRPSCELATFASTVGL